jgi:hypothetical protein
VAERVLVLRLDEEVQMIVLDRHVNDPKRVLAEDVLERAADRAVRRSTTQPRHVLARAQHDMNRVVLRDLGSRAMRRIHAESGLLAPRAVPSAAPRAWTQVERELRLARHLLPTPDRHLD